MARIALDPMPRDDTAEIVMAVLRVQRAREFHRAETPGGKPPAQAGELPLDKRIVKSRVVSHEHGTLQKVIDLPRHLGKERGADHIPVRNAGQLLDRGMDGAFRIQKRLVCPRGLPGINPDNPDLNDTSVQGARSSGFHVHDGQRLGHACPTWITASPNFARRASTAFSTSSRRLVRGSSASSSCSPSSKWESWTPSSLTALLRS